MDENERADPFEAVAAQLVALRIGMHAVLDVFNDGQRLAFLTRTAVLLEQEEARMLPTATSDAFQQLVRRAVQDLQAAATPGVAHEAMERLARSRRDAPGTR